MSNCFQYKMMSKLKGHMSKIPYKNTRDNEKVKMWSQKDHMSIRYVWWGSLGLMGIGWPKSYTMHNGGS